MKEKHILLTAVIDVLIVASQVHTHRRASLDGKNTENVCLLLMFLFFKKCHSRLSKFPSLLIPQVELQTAYCQRGVFLRGFCHDLLVKTFHSDEIWEGPQISTSSSVCHHSVWTQVHAVMADWQADKRVQYTVICPSSLASTCVLRAYLKKKKKKKTSDLSTSACQSQQDWGKNIFSL